MNQAKLFICIKRLISAPNVGLQTIKINIKNHFPLRKPSHGLDLCLNCKMLLNSMKLSYTAKMLF